MKCLERIPTTCLLAAALLGAACGPEAAPEPAAVQTEAPFSSDLATLLDFEFDGELLAPSSYNAERYVEDQLLYTIGQLNGSRSVGRLDALELSGVTTTREGSGYRVRYHARLPVAWGAKTNLPTSYTLILPRSMDSAALEAFTTRYVTGCAEAGAHDVTAGSFWYYYRPSQTGCTLAATDVVRASASISVSVENTNGKYPEYHRVWEDGALVVVAIFGKYEDGTTTDDDAGIRAFNTFVAAVRRDITGTVTVTPAELPSAPGVAFPDVTVEILRADGRRVRVHALLVDNVVSAGAAFDRRYGALSTEADLIAYNGHAGLGQNVRALARKGTFRAGKYQIVFMNGCDTFAYVDGALAETRARLNPDDPTGTRYLDMITNARPSYFVSNTAADMALINGLLAYADPRTYQQMFRNIDRAQVVVVTGEEDNVYVPGYIPGGGGAWAGLDARASLAAGESRRWSTPELAAGTYVVTMRHDPASPGGDADLYVRRGSEPTESAYDCRPYASGSDEECRVTLASAAAIHVLVRGYAARANAFVLAIRPDTATPPPPPPPPATWAGFSEQGTVTKDQEVRLATPTLAAGTYRFVMSGTGDADLYVRRGSAPTTASYDCRPYQANSNETCSVTLTAPGTIHVLVRGYAATSAYTLVGSQP
jgi:hypothetical protein